MESPESLGEAGSIPLVVNLCSLVLSKHTWGPAATRRGRRGARGKSRRAIPRGFMPPPNCSCLGCRDMDGPLTGSRGEPWR